MCGCARLHRVYKCKCACVLVFILARLKDGEFPLITESHNLLGNDSSLPKRRRNITEVHRIVFATASFCLSICRVDTAWWWMGAGGGWRVES